MSTELDCSNIIGNDYFQILQKYLGWGDPIRGLWCIGLEEAGVFDKNTILSLMGITVSDVDKAPEPNDKVASKTSRIVAQLHEGSDSHSYRNDYLYRSESKVFNGNLWPIGKPTVKAWPHHYDALFGLTEAEYRTFKSHNSNLRFNALDQLRLKAKPQAIICYGKMAWPEFRRGFIKQDKPDFVEENLRIEVYEEDKVILCSHFSRGLTNDALDYIVNCLRHWKVNIPFPKHLII